MAYTLNFTDTSKTPITVQPLATDTTSTDLTFVGRGVPNYGQSQQTNFLRLMENFASVTAPLHPVIGQIWYDSTASVEQLKICLDNTIPGQEVWTSIAEMAISSSKPADPVKIGALWYNSAIGKLMVYKGGNIGTAPNIGWMIVGADSTSIGTSQPANPVVGQLYYDTAAKVFYVYTSGGWQAITSTDTSISTVQPTNPVIGTLWFDPAEGVLKIWTGAAWQLSARSAIKTNLTAPTAIQEGELWFDTTNLQLKAWYNNTWNLAVPATQQDEGIKWLGLLAM